MNTCGILHYEYYKLLKIQTEGGKQTIKLYI
jgi:hypothetical protein